MNGKAPLKVALLCELQNPLSRTFQRDYSMSEEINSEGGVEPILGDSFLEWTLRGESGLERKNSPTRHDVKRLNSRNKSPLMRLTSGVYRSRICRRDG